MALHEADREEVRASGWMFPAEQQQTIAQIWLELNGDLELLESTAQHWEGQVTSPQEFGILNNQFCGMKKSSHGNNFSC